MNTEVSSEDLTSAEGAVTASAAEWEVRVDLAAMFRLTHLFGRDDTVWNHIITRAPGKYEWPAHKRRCNRADPSYKN